MNRETNRAILIIIPRESHRANENQSFQWGLLFFVCVGVNKHYVLNTCVCVRDVCVSTPCTWCVNIYINTHTHYSLLLPLMDQTMHALMIVCVCVYTMTCSNNSVILMTLWSLFFSSKANLLSLSTQEDLDLSRYKDTLPSVREGRYLHVCADASRICHLGYHIPTDTYMSNIH